MIQKKVVGKTFAKQAEPQRMDLKKRDRSKHLSILEGSLYSVTSGLTGNFISAFAIALSSSNFIIAMLASLPTLIGAVIQLGVQQVRSLFKTRKSYIVFFSTLQAMMWLPLLFAPALHTPGPWLLLFVTLNTVFGFLIGPVWNSFISDIVDEDERGRFFGTRNMFTGLTAFIATIAAGYILTIMKPVHPFVGFGILFSVACAFRLMSAYFISKMDDPPEAGISTDAPNIGDFLKNADKTPLGKFTIFLMLFNFSVYIAAPFFAVYQLSILQFDYFSFTVLAATSAITSFVTMIFWGKYVDKIGSKTVLVTSAFLIPFVPLFWSMTTTFWLLVLVEAFSGFVWAGFNLSVSTYLFDATDREHRTQQMAIYTLMVQLAVFFGAMLGSGLLGFFDRSNPLAFKTIFIASFVLRFATVALFYKSLRELRIIEVPIKGRLFHKFIAIKPHHGIVYEAALEAPKDAGKLVGELAKEINEEVVDFARKARHEKRPESAIKKLEREEDEQDSKDYLRKLKR
jgi:MFS family permease